MSVKIRNEKGEWVEMPSIGSGTTTGLPTVTEEDNGKVLKVEGGQWSVEQDEATPLSNMEIENLLNNFV